MRDIPPCVLFLSCRLQELPSQVRVDCENESKKSEAFMFILKQAAAGEDPETAAKKLREQMAKAPKTPPAES